MSNFICFKAEWLSTDVDRADIITAFLSEYPFTHFENEGQWLKAFADENDIAESEYDGIEEAVMDYCDRIEWSIVERENWNEMWEKNFFDPLQVGQFYVRATFHPEAPEGVRAITIEPRMSFGTGHHATTRLMLTAMQACATDFIDSKVLDMGSGTGILAIAAEMLGANEVLGVEIDDWVVDNANDNLVINQTSHNTMVHGDVKALSAVGDAYYDVVLANIHREVILADMAEYVRVLKVGNKLFVSGLQAVDEAMIVAHAMGLNMKHLKTEESDGWLMILFEKIA
ncbi:MAG: 50S ribosomal protein L11 methyltransferase [Bacteroidetes bacterium]|nr:50S ribosomal protein L11 methyltransferase [Bacteroidota bacterium]